MSPSEPQLVTVTAALREWLARTDAPAPSGTAGEREQDPVAERLLALTRGLRPRRTKIGDALVLHHPSGPAFAATAAERIVIRAHATPGTLASEPVEGLPGWLAVEPFPPDVTFTRGADVLRAVLARAYADCAYSERKRLDL